MPPTSEHETLVQMFRTRPALAAELLADVLGVAVPAHEGVRAAPADLPDLRPTEYRADAVVVLMGMGKRAMAVVVEVQLGLDPAKRWTWPVYVATLRARLRCPVELLVVCSSSAVAAWCAAPIPLGAADSRLVPRVLGPELVPVVTDLEQAERAPELTVLSAMAHGAEEGSAAVLRALRHCLMSVEQEQAHLYFELVSGALPTPALQHLREIMTTTIGGKELGPFTKLLAADFEARGVATGKALGQALGEAHAVLAVLDARGFSVPDDVRTTITECRDLDQLDRWVRRAATASTVEDLFD